MISNNNDGTNTLQDGDPGNDITVGNWDPSQSPKYSTTRTPVNAVQVRARRNAGSPGGPVSLFFTRVLNWSVMGTSAAAIATSQPSESPIVMCVQACRAPDFEPATFPPELFYLAPYTSEVPGTNGIAWTIFSETSQMNDPDLADSFLCGNAINTCGRRIYTTQGVGSLPRQFRCAFKNPDYQSADKTCSDNIQWGMWPRRWKKRRLLESSSPLAGRRRLPSRCTTYASFDSKIRQDPDNGGVRFGWRGDKSMRMRSV